MSLSTRLAASASTLACAALLAGAAAFPALAADVKVVGITVGSLGNPYFVAAAKGISAKAAELTPGAKVISVSSDYDLNKQFTQIDNFIAAGAKIIEINAADATAIEPAIAKAHAAGAVVAAFDVAAKGADITVMTDNVAAGRVSCQYIVDHLPGQKGDVIIVNGPQVSSVIDRVNGCKEAFKDHPGIKVLSDNQNGQGSRDAGFAVSQSLLTRFPKVDAIFAINDPEAIGAELAAKQAGRSEFFITSVDGAPDIIPEIKNKDGLIKASASQDPYGMAEQSFAYGVGILDGKQPPQKVILLQPTLITAANIDGYGGWDKSGK